MQKNKINWPLEIFNLDFNRVLKLYKKELVLNIVFPEPLNLLRAFELCDFDNLKVVILGQDPYHAFGQAHGLAFSVPKGVKIPPSLRNIFKELEEEGFEVDWNSGDLSAWAKQGVLLLNSALSVKEGLAMSHEKLGWEKWTDFVIEYVSKNKEGLVFLLWGNQARKKKALICESKHLVLESSHPSPLSVRHSFKGCGHFLKANQFLRQPIDWNL